MYHKIIKKLELKEKEEGHEASKEDATYPEKRQHHTGFHAKPNSQIGAARARSIGNRNTKPPR